ncbi:MAG: Tat pathway signal sequence [Coriobacteriales bacterium]|jgi:hypothetical protein|nr:Tat pathway signal sequence [Coriobacteriales bacterium]
MAQQKTSWQELFNQLQGGGNPSDGSSGGSGSGGGGKPGEAPQWSFSPDQITEKQKKQLRKLLKVLLVLALPIIAFCYWYFHPPINIQSQDTWYFVGFFILLPLFLFFYVRYKTYQVGTKKHPKSAKKSTLNKRLMFIPVAVVVAGLIGSLASATFFPGNAARYSSILSIQDFEFVNDIQQVDFNEIPVIDRSSAAILGNRTIGAIPEYVSQFEISSLYSQISYQDHPVRVSPLLYADIIKWITNSATGLPAYVKVDMTTQNAEIVRLEEPMRYSQSEVLNRNIYRHVQLSYPFYLLDEFAFEIDDEGHPWWICPVQKRTIGLFGGTTIQRVILCDAVTGETFDMPIEEVPHWVDKAFPAELLIQQYNWYGSLHNGWINSFLGQEGVVQTTPGTDGMLGYNYLAKDDDVWVYSGVTSAVSDNSIVGFMLINQRTAEGHYYAIAGATEDSAMRSAEGQVQHLNYRSTFPILINIADVPTYFMALKDAAGLVKMYAMLDIQRYQNVAVGDTLANTEAAYKRLLITNGVELGDDLVAPDYETVTGVVKRISTAVVEGNSQFFVTLEGDSNLYQCVFPAILMVLDAESGDEVEISYWQNEGMRVVEEFKIIKRAADA